MYNGRNSFQFIKKRFRSWEKMNKLCGLVGSADRGIASRPCSIRLGMSNRAVFQCKPCIYIDFHTFWTRDVTVRERGMAENVRKGRKEPKEDGKKCLLSSRECSHNGLERRTNEFGKWWEQGMRWEKYLDRIEEEGAKFGRNRSKVQKMVSLTVCYPTDCLS